MPAVNDKHAPLTGVAVVLWRRDHVLMGERRAQQAEAETCWQFPGGGLEQDESIIDCARRELAEETGLSLFEPRLLTMTNRPFYVSGRRYVTLLVSAEWCGGVEKNLEPEKCLQWQWVHYCDMPSPLFEPIVIIQQQLQEQGDDLLALHRRCRVQPEIPAGGHRQNR